MKHDQQQTLWRSMRVLSYVRVLLVSAIVLLSWVYESGLLSTWQPRSIAAGYLGLALVIVFLNTSRLVSYNGLLLGSLVVDLLHIAALIYWSELSRSVFASLLFLPVVGAALLGSRLTSQGTASLATIILLVISFMHYSGSKDDTILLQTALLGTSIFAASLALNKIGQRLLEQESMVVEQKRRLESQVQINRTVVSELDRGLLALNSEGEVQMLNLRGAVLLGLNIQLGQPIQSVLNTHHPVLMQKMKQWQQVTDWESIPAYCDLIVMSDDDGTKKATSRRVRARPMALTDPHTGTNELLVAVEDLHELEGRAMQLKLASMGRLSASIAHEVRNPLAAVSHAAALMAEEAGQDPPRLLRIIQENARRIDRIVEDVLSISRSGRVRPESVVLAKVLSQSIGELQRGNAMPPDRVCLNVPTECRVWFDREHLAQILNNLLQNAARYASMKKCAISISAYPTSVVGSDKNYCDLVIEDDGPGLDAGAQTHLFEPFFTTHAQGTGLGLYLARELATANQASLFVKDEKYDVKKNRGAVFVLRMKQAQSPNDYQVRMPEDA